MGHDDAHWNNGTRLSYILAAHTMGGTQAIAFDCLVKVPQQTTLFQLAKHNL